MRVYNWVCYSLFAYLHDGRCMRQHIIRSAYIGTFALLLDDNQHALPTRLAETQERDLSDARCGVGGLLECTTV